MKPPPPNPRECFLYDAKRGWVPKPKYDEALDALAHRNRNDLRVRAYRCRCGAWHLGHVRE